MRVLPVSTLNSEGEQFTAVISRKVRRTPDIYPRNANDIKPRPL